MHKEEEIEEEMIFSPMGVFDHPRRKDIVGQAGEFIDDFADSIKSEELYHVMGVKPDKSFLITGPPGNGKTFSIEALVNEVNKETSVSQNLDKINLLGFKYDIGIYGTAYINEGSKIIQNFFDECFEMAINNYKTVAIFDEAEVLFGKRSNNYSHKEDTKVLETIMKNMQTAHNMDNMYVVLMSNFPEAFDRASIRAGRIDKPYIFQNPNQPEREFAYNHAIEQINDKAGYMVIRKYNVSKLAEISDRFSYSDITESVNSAVKQEVKEMSDIKTDKILTAGYVTQEKLEKSVHSHRDNFIKTTKKSIGF
ncbi:ATP-binding protein [Candidatus Pacearchaeota archaeon]|nr:ATP-binding protein [Candidatus Pacearchaeota archaeon]